MKVCILGSNLSALTLAKALVNQNIFVDILVSKKSSSFNKSRTIGISKSNVEFFNKHIVNINNIIWKLKKIDIFSENYKKKIINFENNGEVLFCIIKNHRLYEILQKSLSVVHMNITVSHLNLSVLHINFSFFENFRPILKN